MNIYVDMDGVLCNFDKKAKETLGVGSLEEVDFDSKSTWDKINEAGEEYWSTMEWNPGGKKLWDSVKKYNPTILSAPSKDKSCITGKKKWVREHLGDSVPVILEKDKHLHSEPGNVLIDDLPKNINPWNKKGGEGILHKDTDSTLKELDKIIEDNEPSGSITKNIDKIADTLEEKGFIKEAHDLDIISNTIESFQNRPVKIRPFSDVVQQAVRELGPALKNVDLILLEPSCPGDRLAWVSNKDYLKGRPGEERTIHLCLKKIEDRFRKNHEENFTPNDPQDRRQMKNIIVQYLKDVILPHETEHIHQEMTHGGEFGPNPEQGAERAENFRNLENMGYGRK
jgi:hypothetical protein